VKFKIDENLPSELAADLRDLGHEADTVFDEGLVGAKDPVLIAVVASENRILLTLDKGIANLQQYPAEQHSGVVLFRPVRSGRRVVLTFIRERLPDLLELDLRGRLTVVGPTRIRVR
jgi:predicted nuclease of predicted toxin-antitoxin system